MINKNAYTSSAYVDRPNNPYYATFGVLVSLKKSGWIERNLIKQFDKGSDDNESGVARQSNQKDLTRSGFIG